MKYITLNPEYYIKPDHCRALILTKDTLRSTEEYVESVIHPIHASILVFFDGTDTIEGTISKISQYLGIGIELIEKFVVKLVENENKVVINYSNTESIIFPKRTLIFNKYKNDSDRYSPEKFKMSSFILKKERHYTPSRITFMATTRCYTDCIYCYADRRKNINYINFDRVKKLITEAKELNVVSFDVIGGEFFLYNHWREMLILLYQNRFNPYISTKIPLSENDIKFLSDIGMKDIQISLDTLIANHLTNLIRVDERYIENITKTIRLFNKFGIKIQIHTILTSINDSIDDMESIYNIIKNIENVITWKIDYAASTIYKNIEEYKEIKITRDKLSCIFQYFENLKEQNISFKIVSGDLNQDEVINADKNVFYTNQRSIFCAGNYSSLFILPDGKVTICEELYWTPQFILGDLNNESLNEIWNSSTAQKLYYMPSDSINILSPCKKCNILDKCRQELGGVCWRDIIKAYGAQKWDFPDTQCPKAEKVDVDIYI